MKVHRNVVMLFDSAHEFSVNSHKNFFLDDLFKAFLHAYIESIRSEKSQQ